MAKRPETAQTGVKASVWLKEACNELNWVCNPLIEDFGIDFHVKAFESTAQRRALPWEFYVQVKGTTNLRRGDGVVLFPIDTAHLRDWQDARLPVLLVVYDVPNRAGFWLLVKDYLDELGDLEWEEQQSLTLRMPEGQVVTKEGLLAMLATVRRASFLHEAPGVIAFMETPTEETVYDQHFWVRHENPYKQQLRPPDAALRDLALARCVLCENYFWIGEAWTDGHDRIEPGQIGMPENLDFTQIYGPRAHEAAVFSCDSPEEFSPFCTTGEGALLQCARCEKYNVRRGEMLGDWNDDVITKEEAEEHCGACLDDLRIERGTH
jgi:hypothetical protein